MFAAAPVRASGGRQHEEELLGIQAVDRAADGELGAGIGDVPDAAFALPGAVDAHDPGVVAVPELDAFETSPFCAHRSRGLTDSAA